MRTEGGFVKQTSDSNGRNEFMTFFRPWLSLVCSSSCAIYAVYFSFVTAQSNDILLCNLKSIARCLCNRHNHTCTHETDQIRHVRMSTRDIQCDISLHFRTIGTQRFHINFEPVPINMSQATSIPSFHYRLRHRMHHSNLLTVPLHVAQNSLTTTFVCLFPLRLITLARNILLSLPSIARLSNLSSINASSRYFLALGIPKTKARRGLHRASTSERCARPAI